MMLESRNSWEASHSFYKYFIIRGTIDIVALINYGRNLILIYLQNNGSNYSYPLNVFVDELWTLEN